MNRFRFRTYRGADSVFLSRKWKDAFSVVCAARAVIAPLRSVDHCFVLRDDFTCGNPMLAINLDDYLSVSPPSLSRSLFPFLSQGYFGLKGEHG